MFCCKININLTQKGVIVNSRNKRSKGADIMSWIKNNKYMLAFLVIIGLVAYGGYRYYESTTTVEEKVRTATVEHGDLKETVSATGSLSAADNVDISSKITGRIVEVPVNENDHVSAGQVLVRLDDTALRATLTDKESRLEEAAKTLNRYKTLLSTGAISQSVYDTADMNYVVAKSAYEQAESNVNDTVIVSPISGYVIGKPTPVGQTISSGISTPQVIMSIANLDKMQIEAMVDESDIGQVKVGQHVEFDVDSYPDKTFKGVVSLISKSAVTTNNVVYYTTYVDVENTDGLLYPGMTARADMILNRQDDTLMVPANCVYTDKGRTYVKLYDEKNKKETEIDVKVGLTGDDKVAVACEDLRQGDKVVVKTTRTASTNTPNMMGGPPMR